LPSRSPLFRALRHVAAGHGPTRGEFLRTAGLTALGAAAIPNLVACGGSQARGREKIAIVGAGIAGLVTAMHLRDAGIDATIYESSPRVGGRMHSERTYWSDGQHTEWCGAMVDSLHVTMRGLAKRFGLPLLDTIAPRPPHSRDTCYIDGRYYPMADADRDFAKIYPVMQAQLGKINDQTTFANATAEARRLDAMSLHDWVVRYVPGGAASQLGRLIEVAYWNEYGRTAQELSALNLVVQLGEQRHYTSDHEMNVLGSSDQKYIFAGGSQALPEAIAASLPKGSITFGRRLIAIGRRANGSYALTFDAGGGKTEKVSADRVVLAIPFIVLRGVDYAGAGFDAAKTRAIDELGYGYHTKLHLQFDRRVWAKRGRWPEPASGQIWTTLPSQSALDFSLGQPGGDGLIEVFTAGPPTDTPQIPYARIGDSDAVRRHVRGFFSQLDKIWPGVSPAWNGKATFGNAQADPNILASYSCWLVGQCTTIAGHEPLPQGRVHFAGEHTSMSNQGFMEGGAESGLRAAGEILDAYRIKPAR
jgi:monoamine oxidase